MKIGRHSFACTPNHSLHFLKQIWLAGVLFALMLPPQLFAQAPIISYSGGQTYTVGTAIPPLIPNAVNVGAPGYSVSAAAANPALNTILGVAKDSKGNIYIADQTANIIKELPVGGGGPISLGSGFNLPMAVTVDRAGNLFVADYYNNAVKEITANSGAIISIGSGFVNPYNVAADSAGNVYVADLSANPIKKLAPAGGYFITPSLPAGLTMGSNGIISGTPAAPGPLTTYTIFAYNSSGVGSTTIAFGISPPQAAPTISYTTPQVFLTGTQVALVVPSATGVTNAGYVRIPVAASAGIANGQIDVFLIMGQSNAVGAGDVTQSPQTVPGNIFYYGGAVHPANDPFLGVFVTTLPKGSMWPAFGNTYYSITGRNVCFVQTAVGGSSLVTASDVLGKGSWDTNGHCSPQAANQLQTAIDSLVILGYTPVVRGFLWDQGEADASAISNHLITSAAYTDTLLSLAKRFRGQFGAALPFYVFRTGAKYPSPPDYLLWARNAQEAALPMDSLMFIVARNAVTFPDRGLMNPDPAFQTLHYSQAGYDEMGVTGAEGVVLSQKNPATIQLLPGSAAVKNSGAVSNLPASVAIDGAGNIYFSSAVNKTIAELLAGGGTPVALGSGFNSPFGLAVDGSGNIFVADAGDNAIKEIPRSGGSPVTIASGFNRPAGVAVDALGNIYVADTYNNAVKKIPAGGGAPVIIGNGFSLPFAVALDQNGNLFVADAGNNALKKITLAGGNVALVSGGFNKPTGVAVDHNGNIYVADAGNNAVKEIPASGGTPITLCGGFSSPFGIAVDAGGNVYAPDDLNNGIMKISSVGGYYSITPVLPAGLNFDIATGIISGTPVSSSPSTNYSINAFNSAGSNKFVLNIKVTDNVNLSGLLLSNNLVLSPSFTPGTTSYTATAAATLSSVSLTPTAGNSTASVYVNGNLVPSGTASANILLSVGNNVVTTKVVAVDGTSKTYTINITRTAVNAGLRGLAISRGLLTPAFTTDTINYIAGVANGVTSLTVMPTTSDATATVTVNGTAIPSGTASGPITLNVGTNIITTTVTAQDGTTTKTYTITVTRAASNNANLSALKAGSTLSPAFAAGATSYTDNVVNGVTSLTITPITAVTMSTVKVNGVTVPSGTASASIALNVGVNIITTTVTAQDGTTAKTYTITVSRAPSGNASLSALKLGKGMLSPAFAAGTLRYTDHVVNGVSSTTITPITAVTTATVKINGTAVTSGAASAPIILNVGANIITTTVTAQDGVTKKTYTITVTRAGSTNANLSAVKISRGTLTPAFNEATTSYTASVVNGLTSMTVIPTAADPTATIKVIGTPVTSGTASGPIPLSVGANAITTVVTAQDGSTAKTYTLTVTRATGAADGFVPVATGTGISVTQPIKTASITDDSIRVHQGVSPNGDGINDFFTIENINKYPDNKLTIMNRNGQLIYEANGYDNSSKIFDGHSSKNGQMQLPGTYFYQLDYTVKGITQHKTGFIVLKY